MICFILEIYLMAGGFGIVAYLIWWFGIIIYQKGYNAILYKMNMNDTSQLINSDNLQHSVTACYQINRNEVYKSSKKWTWENSTKQFKEALA